MRLVALLPLTYALLACTYADVKARETLRLGPLRDIRPSASDVDSVVTVDAGTDALTDSELAAVERALAPALTESFARLGGVPGGMARVGACKLRAGPSDRFVVYLAKCHVSLVIDGVSAVEVTSEAMRRTQNVFERKSTSPRPAGDERDPAVEARECKAVLVDALDAAARMIVDGSLPLHDGETAPLPRAARAALARERMARAMSSPSTASERVAALYDLRSAGMPSDAALVLPLLTQTPAVESSVLIAALDALGELCEPSLRAHIEAVEVRPTAQGASVGAAPVGAAPVGAAPVGAGPVDGTPHDGAPHDDAPHDGAPHDGAPHDGAPHDGAPADSAPADSAPHDGAPHHGAPVHAARIDDGVARAKERALSRIRACAALPK